MNLVDKSLSENGKNSFSLYNKQIYHVKFPDLMYILKEIACKKDEIEANDRLLKFCVTFGTPGKYLSHL